MNIKQEKIQIANLEVEVVRKDIKNMHLAVYPPSGRIRLAAPATTNDDVIRLFAISKIGWIKKHIKNFQNQDRETPRDYVSGESHYFNGRRYLLNVIPKDGYCKVELKNNKEINLYIKPNATRDDKANAIQKWYRKELKKCLPELIEKWEKTIGVQSNGWGVKQMKTKWGTCNIEEKRIWLNLELAKKPKACLEYVIVHELVHLLERNHNDNFVGYLNQFMPKWRLNRDELNRLPI